MQSIIDRGRLCITNAEEGNDESLHHGKRKNVEEDEQQRRKKKQPPGYSWVCCQVLSLLKQYAQGLTEPVILTDLLARRFSKMGDLASLTKTVAPASGSDDPGQTRPLDFSTLKSVKHARGATPGSAHNVAAEVVDVTQLKPATDAVAVSGGGGGTWVWHLSDGSTSSPVAMFVHSSHRHLVQGGGPAGRSWTPKGCTVRLGGVRAPARSAPSSSRQDVCLMPTALMVLQVPSARWNDFTASSDSTSSAVVVRELQEVAATCRASPSHHACVDGLLLLDVVRVWPEQSGSHALGALSRSMRSRVVEVSDDGGTVLPLALLDAAVALADLVNVGERLALRSLVARVVDGLDPVMLFLSGDSGGVPLVRGPELCGEASLEDVTVTVPSTLDRASTQSAAAAAALAAAQAAADVGPLSRARHLVAGVRSAVLVVTVGHIGRAAKRRATDAPHALCWRLPLVLHLSSPSGEDSGSQAGGGGSGGEGCSVSAELELLDTSKVLSTLREGHIVMIGDASIVQRPAAVGGTAGGTAGGTGPMSSAPLPPSLPDVLVKWSELSALNATQLLNLSCMPAVLASHRLLQVHSELATAVAAAAAVARGGAAGGTSGRATAVHEAVSAEEGGSRPATAMAAALAAAAAGDGGRAGGPGCGTCPGAAASGAISAIASEVAWSEQHGATERVLGNTSGQPSAGPSASPPNEVSAPSGGGGCPAGVPRCQEPAVCRVMVTKAAIRCQRTHRFCGRPVTHAYLDMDSDGGAEDATVTAAAPAADAAGPLGGAAAADQSAGLSEPQTPKQKRPRSAAEPLPTPIAVETPSKGLAHDGLWACSFCGIECTGSGVSWEYCGRLTLADAADATAQASTPAKQLGIASARVVCRADPQALRTLLGTGPEAHAAMAHDERDAALQAVLRRRYMASLYVDPRAVCGNVQGHVWTNVANLLQLDD